MNDTFTILVADDDPDDAFLLQWALRSIDARNSVQLVSDGAEVIAYLEGSGKFADRSRFPIPQALILDMRMPRKTGLDALEWLQEQPEFRAIPTLVLSSAGRYQDVVNSYRSGAHSFMVKPGSLDDLQRVLRVLDAYWKSSRSWARTGANGSAGNGSIPRSSLVS